MLRIVPKDKSQIRLNARGEWFHEGDPFENEKVIQFFHRAIRKDERGEYFLFNVVDQIEEHVYFEVEDTAFFVWELEASKNVGALAITLNTGGEEELDLSTLEESEHGIMYCRVHGGDRARFSYKALERLSDYAETNGDETYVVFGGARYLITSK